MKQLLVLVCCVFPLFAGCQQNSISKVSNSAENSEKSVPSATEVWRGRGNGWVIYMAADGNIPELYRSEGLHMILSEKGTQKESANKQLLVRYTYGNCFWSYDPKTNNLKATVTLDNYYVNARGAELSCGMVDEFEGPVSADKKTWTANWKTITTLDANTPEQISTGRKVIFDRML